MSTGANPYGGRFQTRHQVQMASAANLKGTVGDLFTWVCPFESAELLLVGASYSAAAGAVSTPGQMEFDIQRKDGGARAIANADAVLVFDEDKLIHGVQSQSLQLNAEGPQAYPALSRGDKVIIQHTVQGAGAGDQSVIPFFLVRERPGTENT